MDDLITPTFGNEKITLVLFESDFSRPMNMYRGHNSRGLFYKAEEIHPLLTDIYDRCVIIDAMAKSWLNRAVKAEQRVRELEQKGIQNAKENKTS